MEEDRKRKGRGDEEDGKRKGRRKEEERKRKGRRKEEERREQEGFQKQPPLLNLSLSTKVHLRRVCASHIFQDRFQN